jgi:8-oxo-dGTP pyrophosphatase MutT (NUDIX family)
MAEGIAVEGLIVDETLASYNLSPQEWHLNRNHQYSGIIAAALVFDATGRVLLLRRAAHDFVPGRWEPPGGSVDASDQSLAQACARELKEEAGLVARRVEGAVGEGYIFEDKGRKFHRFTLLVDVEEVDGGSVRVDPDEHSEWTWASAKEVAAEKMDDGREMPVTFHDVKETILEGIRLKQLLKSGQEQ